MIQTSPLIAAIRAQHPDAQIVLMVRQMAAEAARRTPGVDDVYLYDEDEMFLDSRAGDSRRMLRAYARAESYANWIRDGGFDLVFNLTHSIASAMLLAIAEVPKVVGAHMTDDWRFVLRGPWATYFFTSVMHRTYNDFNLCDSMGRFAGSDVELSAKPAFTIFDEDRKEAAALMAEHGLRAGQVFMQLGASDEHKRWPAEKFAALARCFGEQGRQTVLVGVKSEQTLGETFDRVAPGLAISLFGKTELGTLAALLEQAGCLITNDTGTMHLAAAVGCPVVLVSVGYVHFRETGPFGLGHIAIEAAPGNEILVEHVVEAMKLCEGVAPSERPAGALHGPMWEKVSAYRSARAPDGVQTWLPLGNRAPSETDVARMAYRAMWMREMSTKDNQRELDESFDLQWSSYSATAETYELARKLAGDIEELCSIGSEASGLARKIRERLERPGRAKEAQRYVKELIEVEERLRLFGEIHDACRPLVALAKFERDNIENAPAKALADQTVGIYTDLTRRAKLLTDYLSNASRRDGK